MTRTSTAAAMLASIAAAAFLFSPAAAASASAAEKRPQRDRPPANGGVAIVSSAANARAVVTGVVGAPEQVDTHGWSAPLRVDRVLAGDASLGETLKMAWEELSRRRAVRFEDGMRILVVLDALPTQSLWRKRFPSPGERGVFVVAASSDAFLRTPDAATVDTLVHYLALAPDARDGAPGVVRLAELVATAAPTLATEALELLDAKPDVASLLGTDGSAAIVRALASTRREMPIRSAALWFAAKHRLPGTKEAALALTEPGSPLRPQAYRALAQLPDGVAPDRVEALLSEGDAELRAVGADLAAAAELRPRLVELARKDPAPAVRLAAGKALLERHGAEAIAETIGMLEDSDRSVSSGIANALGKVGEPAIEPLREVVEKGSEDAALAGVLGLSRAGRKGAEAVFFIAQNHENEKVRDFAQLALGKLPSGHSH